MRQRSITGILFAAVVIPSMLYSPYTFMLLYLVVAVIGHVEYGKMLYPNDLFKNVRIVLSLLPTVALLLLNAYLFQSHGWWHVSSDYSSVMLLYLQLFAFGVWLFFLLILELYSRTPLPFEMVGKMALSFFYICIPVLCLYNLAFYPKGFSPQLPLALMLMVWANDVFAYLIGSQIGRTKLFERISPKKTWEGSIGGFICCMITGYIIGIYMPQWGYTHLSPPQWLVFGAVCSLFGTLGDLVESMLKRSVGVKDSGTLLPGHGGVLDRFDAYFFVAPWAFILFFIFFA